MTTIKDVANEAKVSVGSVSRYLNGYELKKDNRISIERAIKKLNYIQNQTAKSLKMNKSFSIGVIVDTMDNFYSSQLIASLERLLDKNNYFLLLASHHDNEKMFNYKLSKLIERSVDGLIIVKANQEWTAIEKLKDMVLPVIAVEVPLDKKIPSVISDDKDATKQVISWLLSKNKKMGFIIPSERDYVLRHRLMGIEEAYTKHNKLVMSNQVAFAEYGTDDAYYQTKRLLNSDVRALFITNYVNAVLAVKAIQDSNKILGKDVLLASFGYSDLFEKLNLPITIIKQSINDVSQATVDILLNLLIDKEVALTTRKIIVDDILWDKK